MSVSDGALPVGIQPGVTYPLQVLYCGNCSLPIEYCEYHPQYDKCKQWLERNLPDEFEKVVKLSSGGVEEDGGEEKKRQKRGGKGIVKAKKKEDGPKQVYSSLSWSFR